MILKRRINDGFIFGGGYDKGELLLTSPMPGVFRFCDVEIITRSDGDIVRIGPEGAPFSHIQIARNLVSILRDEGYL